MKDFKKYKLIAFDLDKTLTISKSPLDSEMAKLLNQLLAQKKVAIISGGNFPQFEVQVIQIVSNENKNPNFSNFFICATMGAKMFEFKNESWINFFEEKLSEIDRKKIIEAIKKGLEEFGFDDKNEPKFGERIEDRGTQVTFSALGQLAPPDLKSSWDPDRSKKLKLKSLVEKYIPEFEVKVGGSTSIDITKKGINKGFAVQNLCKHLGIEISEVFFIGDELKENGNDYAVKLIGVDCYETESVEDTKRVIREILESEKLK
ncbi:MAG: HAD-IIB family hydrolase [Patescibacteria group bacterium]